jgi:hypothetical protein
VARYRAYFSFPPNNYPPGDRRQERYYSFQYGPVAIIVLDTNNDSISTDDPATNWDTSRHPRCPLVGENEPPAPGGKGLAPDVHGGPRLDDSLQYRWLVRSLQQAAENAAFIFVVFHQAPFSSFVHGRPDEPLSGYPLRKLDPLFHRFGVDAVFSGHDEAYERSVTEARSADRHKIHYYVLPTIGDPTGLRVPVREPTWQEGFSRFIYPLDNRHYGYLDVRVEPIEPAGYRATITPRYIDPDQPTRGDLFYDDVVELMAAGPRVP